MFDCYICHKEFSSNYWLQYHIRNQVCINSGRICPHCKKVFARKQNCMGHIRRGVCQKQKTKIKLILKSSYEKMSQQELIDKLTRENLSMKGKIKSLKEHIRTL